MTTKSLDPARDGEPVEPQSETRPWGHYQILHEEKGIKVKRIEVKPHARLSLQKHSRRAEKWTVIAGSGIVTLGTKDIHVKKGSFIDIPVGEIHRMHNTGEEPLAFVEVQFGDYLGEDDIVRLEDDFGRK